MIPKNLYTCWHTSEMPPLMKANWLDNIAQNKELNFYFFDEKKCIDFIKKNFDKRILRAYLTLVPCSYKSDLWRFCILYLYGGIYMDIKYKCEPSFKLISITDKDYFVEERQNWKGKNERVYTGLIVSTPQNKIFLNCIEKIVENIEKKYYGLTSLDPTGPGVLGLCVPQSNKNNLSLRFLNDNIYLDDKIILGYYQDYRKEQIAFQKKPHYAILWNQKKIYNRFF